MLDQKTTTVGGVEYVIQQLPTSKGLKVAVAIGHLAAGMSKGVGFTTSDLIEDTPINVGGLVAGILERLDQEGTPSMIKLLVLDSVITPKMSPDDYERVFSGEFDNLAGLLVEIIEHNKFLDVLKKRFSPLIARLFSEGGTKPKASTPSTKAP